MSLCDRMTPPIGSTRFAQGGPGLAVHAENKADLPAFLERYAPLADRFGD